MENVNIATRFDAVIFVLVKVKGPLNKPAFLFENIIR